MNLPRILFVDESSDTCEMAKVWLSQFGYEGEAAASVNEGLRKVQSGRFELYILGNKFPDGEGSELCSLIRKIDSVTPMIFYSGDSTEKLNSALGCGAQAWVLKPELNKLRTAISYALNIGIEVSEEKGKN